MMDGVGRKYLTMEKR